MQPSDPAGPARRIAVIGSGIAGLSAAWLLARRHEVTVLEAETRPGGHSCTVEAPGAAGPVPVDMGFIVYNEPTYPNLTALFRHLGVATQESCMSFAVSLDAGGFEYGGHDLNALFAQRRNLARPRFWAMLAGLARLYRAGAGAAPDEAESLGAWLDRHRVPPGVQRDHLLPMAAAIWSAPAGQIRAQPAAAFLRFCDTHGLLRLTNRPAWRTVTGGARAYVTRLRQALPGGIQTGRAATAVRRMPAHVVVSDQSGHRQDFDDVVLAVHADTALGLLQDADDAERAVLGAFRFAPNRAVLHGDARLMPRRKAAWASWNFLGGRNDGAPPVVTYWMNRLQSLPGPDLFVTLNPPAEPARLIATRDFDHPIFDLRSRAAQAEIWALQGARRIWFAGAWLGAGFHEDGIQSGLAVAEALGGVPRPWPAGESRLRLPAGWGAARPCPAGVPA